MAEWKWMDHCFSFNHTYIHAKLFSICFLWFPVYPAYCVDYPVGL